MATLNVKKAGSGFLLEFGGTRLALDTGVEGLTTLLSHSHADHISGIQKAEHIVATRGTFETWIARGGKTPRDRTVVELREPFSQIGVTVTAYNAGHVLGSSMFLIEFDEGARVLYTGDFNNVDSVVHKAASPVRADVLITEATYGTPQWVFPDREDTHGNIVNAARKALEENRIVVFSAYSLGKAQEAIAVLQHAGFSVISGNMTIDSVSRVYNNHGKRLRSVPLRSNDTRTLLSEGGIVVSSSFNHTIRGIMNHLKIRSRSQLEDRIDKYSLSGWTLGKFRERGFPLSAHSDFNGLVGFARAVDPRVAYCFTENGLTLSNHLSEMGMNAVPLE
jgi:putative mRNA 3-end processing factor